MHLRRDGSTKSFREILMARAGGRCEYCGAGVAFFARSKARERSRLRQATIDHLVPRAAGGSGRLDNLVLSCFECNQLKADFNPYADDPEMMELLTR